MTVRDLVVCSRSFRRFREDRPIDDNVLRGLVDLARLCPSAANRQPLKYLISCDPKRNALIFSHLRWAAALKDWPGPAERERPSGYILILGDTRITRDFHCDHAHGATGLLGTPGGASRQSVVRGWRSRRVRTRCPH